MAYIIDYVVITSSKGIDSFEALIKDNIKLGWQPLGGVSMINSTSTDADLVVTKSVTYGQAMVKYES